MTGEKHFCIRAVLLSFISFTFTIEMPDYNPLVTLLRRIQWCLKNTVINRFNQDFVWDYFEQNTFTTVMLNSLHTVRDLRAWRCLGVASECLLALHVRNCASLARRSSQLTLMTIISQAVSDGEKMRVESLAGDGFGLEREWRDKDRFSTGCRFGIKNFVLMRGAAALSEPGKLTIQSFAPAPCSLCTSANRRRCSHKSSFSSVPFLSLLAVACLL